ncbi:MAG: hypothetical protein WCW26_00075 [Candidatus Buchananbacteria bacterium]
MKKIQALPKKTMVFLGLILVLVGLIIFSFWQNFGLGKTQIYGVTFSKKYATELGLDWQKNYLAILYDLKVSHVRLIAYWDEIEKTKDQYDFSELDWQLRQATNAGAKVILTVGRRTPRWPECHDPLWLNQLNNQTINQKQLDFVKTTILRYQDQTNVSAWQIENEPMLSVFGQCPTPSLDLLRQEVNLVKSLDKRLVIVTDSGELGDWQKVAGVADVLGSTMYRIVWNKYFGFWDYFFVPPAFYRYKADLTQTLHPNLRDVIITELQMEPWTLDGLMINQSIANQQKSFTLKRFKDNIAYVKKAGFSQVYLWGVEYWYWQMQQGYPEYWQQAKKLWQ